MSIGNITSFRGRDALDANGEKIGSIDEIYEDTETGKPEWLAVKTGLFGTKVSFMPLAEASESGRRPPRPLHEGSDQGRAERRRRRRPLPGGGAPPLLPLRAAVLGDVLGLRPAAGWHRDDRHGERRNGEHGHR